MKQFLVAAVILGSMSAAVLHASDEASGATVTVTVTSVTNKWHACKYEDGAGQTRCVWVGDVRGNGEGQSFFKNRRGFHFITHERAVHMLSK